LKIRVHKNHKLPSMKLGNRRCHIQKQQPSLLPELQCTFAFFKDYWKYQCKYKYIQLTEAVKIYPFIKSFKVIGPYSSRRSQWPCLRRRSAIPRLLRSWVRIPPGAWMFVCYECCVWSGTGVRDERITRPEKSYRMWCVVVCDLETLWMRRPWPTGGCRAKNIFFSVIETYELIRK
jgi:hypothetical protein